MFEKFIDWLYNNFRESEREDILSKYTQSGEYPESFWDDWNEEENANL